MQGSLPQLATSLLLAALAVDGLSAQRPVPARPVSPTPQSVVPTGVPVVPQPGQPGQGPRGLGTQGVAAMPNCGVAGLVLAGTADPDNGTIAADGRATRAAVRKVRSLDWSRTLRQTERASKRQGGKPMLFIQAYGELSGYT